MFDKMLIDEISQIALDHDVEPAALMAVVEVESNGKLGAKIKGRFEPIIRFEGHYFYKLLTNTKRNVAIVNGLASSKAGVIQNPFRQVARWRLLKRAENIDRSAALASCSWGVGQVMGAHWHWLGYASIDALVSEVRAGVDGQVKLMMRYIIKARLINRLKNHDWSGFARAYNGPAYKRYKYHLKMQKAYERIVVSLNGESACKPALLRHKIKMPQFGSQGEDVKQLQMDLNKIGFALLQDGDFGPATERVLKQFQREHRLLVDGIFGPKSLEILRRKLPAYDLSA